MITDTNFIIPKKNQRTYSSVPKPMGTKTVAPKSKINKQTIRTQQGIVKMKQYLDHNSSTKYKKE